MKYSFFIIITALLFFSSCKSKIETISDASCESCEDAIIRFYGEPASGGRPLTSFPETPWAKYLFPSK